jgi:hypothetical protein
VAGSLEALIGLLHLLKRHEGAVEADLQRFYGIDYRDRWRFDENGARRLTLRRIFVLVQHLPPESAIADLARDGKPHWSIEAQLLDDLRVSLTGSKDRPSRPHPARPKPSTQPRETPERRRKLAAARRRARERRRLIDAGLI